MIFVLICSFGGGQFLPVFVYGTYCIGDESRLADCSNISTSVPGCDYTNNVAITCNGKMICKFVTFVCSILKCKNLPVEMKILW